MTAMKGKEKKQSKIAMPDFRMLLPCKTFVNIFIFHQCAVHIYVV